MLHLVSPAHEEHDIIRGPTYQPLRIESSPFGHIWDCFHRFGSSLERCQMVAATAGRPLIIPSDRAANSSPGRYTRVVPLLAWTSCIWAFMRIRTAPSRFCSRLLLRYRLSFWCWWIKAQTGNRIQRKDSQGLPYIVEQLSTPLIHLIRFSQPTPPPPWIYGIQICDGVSFVTLRARCIPINISKKREKN